VHTRTLALAERRNNNDHQDFLILSQISSSNTYMMLDVNRLNKISHQ